MVARANKTEDRYITDDEALAVLEEQAQQNLHMSARAFLAAGQEGAITDPDRPEVMDLVALLPLARQLS
jgi:D-alanyl-D-alanine dipeptidase